MTCLICTENGDIIDKSVSILIVTYWRRKDKQEADNKNPKHSLHLEYAKTNNYFDFEE